MLWLTLCKWRTEPTVQWQQLLSDRMMLNCDFPRWAELVTCKVSWSDSRDCLIKQQWRESSFTDINQREHIFLVCWFQRLLISSVDFVSSSSSSSREMLLGSLFPTDMLSLDLTLLHNTAMASRWAGAHRCHSVYCWKQSSHRGTRSWTCCSSVRLRCFLTKHHSTSVVQ